MSAASQFFGGGGGVSALIGAEVLVVGGGGPGGGPISPNPFGYVTANGGGGAGQLIHTYLELQQGVTYPVTVGAGGGDSIFHTIRSTSGQSSPAGSAFSGFSSAAGSRAPTPGSPDAGITFGEILSVSRSGSSFSGANGGGAGAFNPNGFQAAGGGGGGATAAGNNAPSNTVHGPGGAGYTLNITGISSTFAAGGPGGSTGGGTAPSGASNTGNGGGGAYTGGGAPAGGSGIVIIAYPTSFPAATSVTGTYLTPSRSGYHVYEFTGSGSITI